MLYNWEGIAEFVTVAETESFTLAAKKTRHFNRSCQPTSQRAGITLGHQVATAHHPQSDHYRNWQHLLSALPTTAG